MAEKVNLTLFDEQYIYRTLPYKNNVAINKIIFKYSR